MSFKKEDKDKKNKRVLKRKRKSSSSSKKNSKVIGLKQKRRAKKEARTEVIVLSIVMLLFSISIGGSIINLLTREDIPTMVVLNESVEILNLQQGVIIRDEKVYTSTYEGEVTFEVDLHDRVRPGTTVATIRDSDVIDSLEEETKYLNERILQVQDRRSDISAFSSDISTINENIQMQTNDNIYRLLTSDVSAMYEIQQDIESELELRNAILLTENRGDVEDYVNRNMAYEEMIQENMRNISIDNGGLFSYYVDGLENILTFDNKNFLTLEQTRVNIDNDSIYVPSQVRLNENLFRIVMSNTWFIASHIENEFVEPLTKNSLTTIYIQNENESLSPLEVMVYEIIEGDTESYVIFKSRREILNFIDQRTIFFQTSDSIYTGIKVPQKALTTRTFLKIPRSYVSTNDEISTITIKTDQSNIITEINPRIIRGIEQDEEYVYIIQDFLDVGVGSVILSETGSEYVISQVVTDRGVFRVNNGIATFVSLNLDDAIITEDGYIILSEENNIGIGALTVHDRIISDVENYFIQEGQIVF